MPQSVSSASSYSSYSTSYSPSLSSSLSSEVSSTSLTSSLLQKHTKNLSNEPISTLFAGYTFFFDKDSFKTIKERQKIASVVKDHSASISLMLTKKTTHLIIDQPTDLLQSLEDVRLSTSIPKTITHSLIYQLNTAIKQNIKVATLNFIYESIHQHEPATRHIANFTREINIIAPEIPLMCASDYSPSPTSYSSVDEDINQQNQQNQHHFIVDPFSKETEASPSTTPFVDNSVEENDNIQAMATADYTPTLLPPRVIKQFSPKTYIENGKTLRIMSILEPLNAGSANEVSLSYEESRYYHYFLADNGANEICLDLPKRPESKMGTVWSWGNGKQGQLGSGDKRNNPTPTVLSLEEELNDPIAQVACGDYHSAVVTRSGDVWTWGAGKTGCLGHDELRGSIYPMLVEAFTNIKVCMVACGKSHTAALTEYGTIWTWGSNRSMQLGYDTGADKISRPQEVFGIKEAVFVACGGNNTATLNRYGCVYTMGCNNFGQRGIGKKKGSCPPPSPSLVTFPAKANIKLINIGQGFMGALDTAGGDLYMWGRNLDNQCGNGSAHDVFTPQKIDTGTEVIQFSCGDTHAAYVTANGDVFTWGWGPVGQLGHSADTPCCTVPTHVESVSDVCMVSCGARHTVALSSNRGKIWVWGANDYGQAGIPVSFVDDDDDADEGDDEEEYSETAENNTIEWITPQIIESLSRISMIACGKEHTFVIIEEEYVPIQFAKDGNDEALYVWLENNPKLRDLDDAAFKVALESVRDDELGSDMSLLHLATYFANESILILLAGQQWLDPDITDNNGDTPLHICAERDLPGSAQILLKCGAKPDLKNKIGKTAIHISVEHRTLDVLKEFVENSISDKSVVDGSGNTPLHYAIQKRHFDMAKFLIQSAAQPQILDKSGKTAFDYCSFKEASYFKLLAQSNDVFISYAHTDVAFASKMKEFLESHSIKCWMDMTRLEAGSDWRLDIGNGVLSSKLILFVGSRASVVSDWCIKELHMAKKRNLVIIPIWFQKVEFDSEVKSLLFGRGFLDFSTEKYFVACGNKLARKLKYVLSIIKQAKPNPYLDIPTLTTEQLWKQLFLTIMIESHVHYSAGCTLETVLHRSAIFSCTHNLHLSPTSPYFPERQDNLDRTWGVVFLIHSLAVTRSEIEKWWQFADERGKKVYICMIRGDASDVKPEDLPSQALKQTSVPIFYLENMASLHQLIFFVHLSQREQFMAKQVGVMENKLHNAVTTIKNNETELVGLKKRFYVE